MSTDRPPAPVIFGCEGLTLTAGEQAFFAGCRPAGFILFARNCQDRAQVRALVEALRAVAGTADPLILIDQEGGRVQRLTPPEWRKAPPAAPFAELAHRDPDAAAAAVRLNTLLIAGELRELAINTDCAPVVDLPAPGSHDIIGDRAFGDSLETVTRLARAMAEAFLEGGVLPVIKHLPGHGRALADSHLELPVVRASRGELSATDFAAFRAVADMPLGMTAHVVYADLDDQRPATTSPIVVQEVIRGEIGFQGMLMSDDLSMKALAGSMADRTVAALAAGCDVVLHCNGEMDEMAEIAAAAPPVMDDAAAARLAAAAARIAGVPAPGTDGMEARLADLMQAGEMRG